MKRQRWLFLGILPLSQSAMAMDWETQAQRLQEVSTSLLDGAPMPSPLADRPTVRAQTVLSFLPKVNAQVGAKSEDVPSSPVHTIPTVSLEVPIHQFSSYQSEMAIQAGFLPSGAESLLGIKATLKQQSAGATFALAKEGTGFLPFSSVSWHHTEVAMRGPISSKAGHDAFDVRTDIATFGVGTQLTQSYGNFWGSASAAWRRAESSFFIEEDATTIDLSDDSSHSLRDWQRQVAFGLDLNFGVRVAIGVIDTPNRSRMPRASFAYSRAL